MSEATEIPRVAASAWADTPDFLQAEILARFARAGVMIFDDAFAASLVSEMHAAYAAAYASYHRDGNFDDALAVGDRRTMITVAVAGVFNDPGLYAHPMLLPVIGKPLGDDAVLGSFVAVTALPGSRDQKMHLDMPLLFEADRVSPDMPSYALTLVIPLVDMNHRNGTTAFHPGSHLVFADGPPDVPPVAPDVPVGSALLFDARVWHGGTPNWSTAPRPVLYNTYQRSWFRDTVNFRAQPPLRIPAREWAKVPDIYRFLFDWANPPHDG